MGFGMSEVMWISGMKCYYYYWSRLDGIWSEDGLGVLSGECHRPEKSDLSYFLVVQDEIRGVGGRWREEKGWVSGLFHDDELELEICGQ